MINIREKITAKKFDAIISLGADCLPALTFKTLGLADRYYPLDFLYRKQDKKYQLDMVIDFIKNDFKYFFNYDDLEFIVHKSDNNVEIHNNCTQYVFLHDLKTKDYSNDDLYKIKDKYNRRIARFYDTINNASSVLFIYMEKNNVKHISTDIFVQIWNVLCEKFPNTDINCVFFTHDRKFDKNEYKEHYLNDNVLHVQLNNDEQFTLRQNDGWWRNENLFRDLFLKYALLNKPYKINDKPKVSFLLPTYNSEKYLIQCMNSIFNQTFQDFEVLIVDDASTDATRQILESYQDERIRIIDGPNKGLAAALNVGIKEAKGEYIARIDADDIALPNRLEKQVNYLDNHKDISIVGSWQEHFGKYNSIHKAADDWQKLKIALIFRCDLCHSTLMLRKSDIIKYSLFYPEHSLQEDYELWCQAINHIKIANIPEILGMYRISGESITDAKLKELVKYEANIVVRNLREHFNIVLNKEDINLVMLRNNVYNSLSEEKQKQFEKKLKSLYEQIEQKNKEINFVSPEILRQELEYNWERICNHSSLISSPYCAKLSMQKEYKKIQIKLFCFVPIYSKEQKKGKISHKILGIPFLKIKNSQNGITSKYYFLGLPVLKISNKQSRKCDF